MIHSSRQKPLITFIAVGTMLFGRGARADTVPADVSPEKTPVAAGETPEEAPSDTPSAPPEQEEPTPCLPDCRGGYLCIKGQCLSPCNPPCAGDQICTRNGICLDSQIRQQAMPIQPVPHPVPSIGKPTYGDVPDDATIEYNKRKYREFQGRKGGGSAMIALGSLFIGTAFGLGAAAGATGQEELLFAAIGVEIVGDLLLFPGIAVYVTGTRGMAKAKSNFYRPTALADELNDRNLAAAGRTDRDSPKTWTLGVAHSF